MQNDDIEIAWIVFILGLAAFCGLVIAWGGM